MDTDKTEIIKKIQGFEKPKRKAISSTYPKLKPSIIFFRRALNHFINTFDFSITQNKSHTFFEHVVTRHSSLLMRKLGTSDPQLQEQKIKNLTLAAERLNGVTIPPGKTFSFWHVVGNPTSKKGYVNGMLLSDGKVIEGIGGGLCQMSNLLFWLFLHSPIEIKERYHHSRDVFPDHNRILPFGSGATIFYNLIDLKIKNTSSTSLQLKIWLTDTQLKGQILSEKIIHNKYHIKEENHLLIKKGDSYYRYNKLWREKLIEGKVASEELVATNFALIMYEITEEYIHKNKFNVLEIK